MTRMFFAGYDQRVQRAGGFRGIPEKEAPVFEFQVAKPNEKALLCGSGPSRRDFLQVGALAAVGL